MVNRRPKQIMTLYAVVVCGFLFIPNLQAADADHPSLVYANSPSAPTPEKQLDNQSELSTPPQTPASPELAQNTQKTDPDPIESKTIAKKQPSNVSENLNPSKDVAAHTPSLWRTLVALIAVLSLIIFTAWIWKKILPNAAKKRASHALKILTQNPINPKQSLCLVKLGARLLVIGVSPNHIAALDVIDDPDEIAAILGQIEQNDSNSVSNSFTHLFKKNTDDYNALDIDGPPGDIDWDGPAKNNKFNAAKGEISALLGKVKGLTRMHLKSGLKQ